MLIDLNADLGEGAPHDLDLMPLITSANVCCGAHAGGPEHIARTLDAAKLHGVAIGAHPGYPDRANFGRVELDYPRNALTKLIADQLQVMDSMARERGLAMAYVKPHGGLYNKACRDRETAEAVVAATVTYGIPVVGLPKSQLETACRGRCSFVSEGFADRRYRPDGSLVPRGESDPFIHDPQEAVRQVERLIEDHGVRTICIHGDNAEAVAFARAVRAVLIARGFELKSYT